MPKARAKTVETDASVDRFLAAIEDDRRAQDCRDLVAMMQAATGEGPRMWGSRMVGFGRYQYRYDSGRDGSSFVVGFAPSKSGVTIYIVPGFGDYADLLARLGRHKTAKVCLYVSRLDTIDRDVLFELVSRSVADMRAKYS